MEYKWRCITLVLLHMYIYYKTKFINAAGTVIIEFFVAIEFLSWYFQKTTVYKA